MGHYSSARALSPSTPRAKGAPLRASGVDRSARPKVILPGSSSTSFAAAGSLVTARARPWRRALLRAIILPWAVHAKRYDLLSERLSGPTLDTSRLTDNELLLFDISSKRCRLTIPALRRTGARNAWSRRRRLTSSGLRSRCSVVQQSAACIAPVSGDGPIRSDVIAKRLSAPLRKRSSCHQGNMQSADTYEQAKPQVILDSCGLIPKLGSFRIGAGRHRFCFVGFRRRTPAPPPFWSMMTARTARRSACTLRPEPASLDLQGLLTRPRPTADLRDQLPFVAGIHPSSCRKSIVGRAEQR